MLMGAHGDILQCRLEDGDVALSILNLGAITRGWWVPCRGQSVPVVLGYDDPEAYRSDPNYLGVVAGRVANRVAGSAFLLGGQTFQLTANEGANHLHGGKMGLSRRLWQMDKDSAERRVELRYTSPDGEEGYPGEARFRIEIALSGNVVTYLMEAQVDRPTPINLAQHNYYNLLVHGDIWDHHLTCEADRFTPTDDTLIPTGQIELVDGTCLDYRAGAKLNANDPNHEGTDINLVLPRGFGGVNPAATVRAPNGVTLRMWSDQPGLQFYTGTALNGIAPAHDAQSIAPFGGLCLEPQGFPNAINLPSFPSIVVTPDQPYCQVLKVEIKEDRP